MDYAPAIHNPLGKNLLAFNVTLNLCYQNFNIDINYYGPVIFLNGNTILYHSLRKYRVTFDFIFTYIDIVSIKYNVISHLRKRMTIISLKDRRSKKPRTIH